MTGISREPAKKLPYDVREQGGQELRAGKTASSPVAPHTLQGKE